MKKKSKKISRAEIAIKTIHELFQELEHVKPLYAEIDRLVLSLVGKRIPKYVCIDGKKFTVQLLDRFAEKNTNWGFAPVKRYEVKINESD